MTKDSYIKIGLVLIILIGVLFIYFSKDKIEHLEPPLLKASSVYVGKEVTLSGVAYPNSRIAVYVNDSFVDEFQVSDKGQFENKIQLSTEGEVKIKAKQLFKNLTSDFSDLLSVQVDLTPPDKNSLKLTSGIAEKTQEQFLEIKGSVNPGEILQVGTSNINVNPDGSFEDKIKLVEGLNTLEFIIKDKVGNSVVSKNQQIYVDSIAPKIVTSSFECRYKDTDTLSTQEKVCIEIGDWSGYLDSYNSLPIVGSVTGQIKSISVNEKSVEWDENNEIYQRLNLYLSGGINKYKVIVEDISGNVSSAYIETSAERTQDTINLNIDDY